MFTVSKLEIKKIKIQVPHPVFLKNVLENMSIKSLKYVKKSALKCFEFLPYKSKIFAGAPPQNPLLTFLYLSLKLN